MPQNIKHMIVNSVQVFNIYNNNNLQHFSILYNVSIFSFQSLCVSKCVAWNIFHIYFKSVVYGKKVASIPKKNLISTRMVYETLHTVVANFQEIIFESMSYIVSI